MTDQYLAKFHFCDSSPPVHLPFYKLWKCQLSELEGIYVSGNSILQLPSVSLVMTFGNKMQKITILSYVSLRGQMYSDLYKPYGFIFVV